MSVIFIKKNEIDLKKDSPTLFLFFFYFTQIQSVQSSQLSMHGPFLAFDDDDDDDDGDGNFIKVSKTL